MPRDMQLLLSCPHPIVAVPLNVVEHIVSIHPKDIPALNNLDRFVTAYEYIQAGQMRRDRVVFYSRFDGIWRRGVIVATQGDHAPSILVTLYRRDEKKVRKAIEGGMLFRRGEGGWK